MLHFPSEADDTAKHQRNIKPTAANVNDDVYTSNL
jgi:hypothetical protein